jgi:uncharacterized membrane protein YhaH (DUF805 family)
LSSQSEKAKVGDMFWYIQGLKKYAVFSGRASRTEYWMFVLSNLLIAIVISVAEGLVTGSGKSGLAVLTYKLAVVVPFTAVYVRRLHDVGRSGWWILVPVVNFVMCCFDSQAQENKYGPNPKQAESAELAKEMLAPRN